MEYVNEEKTSNTRCDCCREFFDTTDLNIIFQDGAEVAFLCFACKRDREELLAAMDAEPECTCHQTDVDLFDARGCELHDRNSGFNIRQRAERTNEIVTVFSLSEMEETCPF